MQKQIFSSDGFHYFVVECFNQNIFLETTGSDPSSDVALLYSSLQVTNFALDALKEPYSMQCCSLVFPFIDGVLLYASWSNARSHC